MFTTISFRLDIRLIRLIGPVRRRRFGLYKANRDQRQSQITHFLEQAVQRGLVDRRAGQQRIAVLCQRDGQAFEPVHPLRRQVARDPDLVGGGVSLCWLHERHYTGRAVLPDSNLSIEWSIVLED